MSNTNEGALKLPGRIMFSDESFPGKRIVSDEKLLAWAKELARDGWLNGFDSYGNADALDFTDWWQSRLEGKKV